jgi:hypothetical protein
MATIPATATQTLAPEQLKAQLWADAQQQVYAIVMASRVPDLPARLAAADVDDYDCLLPGALTPEQEAQAPYMVQLARRSAFTDWLLFEAGRGLGDWGVIVLSDAQRLALRSHLRALRQAQLPDGQRIELDWMDPAVLGILLPLFDGAALGSFIGPIRSFVIPGSEEWTTVDPSAGQLQWRRARLAAAS